MKVKREGRRTEGLPATANWRLWFEKDAAGDL
jgi:hypothetical protein